MHEFHRFQFDTLFRQINTVKFKAMQMRIPLTDSFKVLRVYIQPNDSCSGPAVDVVESVPASDSQNPD